MPLYEYECTACHRRIEKIQKFADAPLTVCPHCSGALERTITAPAFQFAGGGWYKDGYASAKPSGSSSDSASGSGDSASGSAGPLSAAAAPASSSASPSAPAASAAPAAAAPAPSTSSGSSSSGS